MPATRRSSANALEDLTNRKASPPSSGAASSSSSKTTKPRASREPVAVKHEEAEGDKEEEEPGEPEAATASVPEPDDEPEPAPASTPATAQADELAPTAQSLAAAARNAALNHVAIEREREREKQGRPRLVIHQIVLENFKSYRGREVIGPFHKSFSAIVGPNGSGKSNTIDALLFVFGYRATKMRQGKLSELIHNSGTGTADASPDEIDSCTVEVWFREIIDLPGKDDFEIVENSQIVVARTAYRNNGSRYTINGKVSSYSEVTTLLRGRGIDLDHKRFLILQGEVESIAQMKPKGATEHEEGLLEYLEDIIGTSKYKTQIEEAMVEVDRLSQTRGEKMTRLKLVEREKSALEGRKRDAEAYLRRQNELVHNQSALLQLNVFRAHEKEDILRTRMQKAEEELKSEVDGHADHRKETESLQREHDELAKQVKVLETESNKLSKELAALERADIQAQEKAKAVNTKRKKLEKSIAEDSRARSEAQSWIQNHGEEGETLQTEITKLESQLEREEASLDSIREGLKSKTEKFSTQIEELQHQLQPWNVKISEKRAVIDLTTNERNTLVKKSGAAQTAMDEVKQLKVKLAKDVEASSSKHASLQEERESAEKRIAKLDKELKERKGLHEKARAKVSAARNKAEEAMAAQRANRSRGDVLNSLTKLRDQGRLDGFHGRLGSLGRIDEKYDVAISTACPDLDNLVVDTLATGQACLEHLRRNDLGRAKVMCLDRITPRNMQKLQTPENAPRLFDLITFKHDRFAPAFFQVLANTLVADDLAQANRIAYGAKRWRVVTLDGKLIDTSGTMSGGGNRVNRGGMSSTLASDEVSPEMVTRYEKERTKAEEELRDVVSAVEGSETELSTLRARLPEIETEISRVELDIKACEERSRDADLRLRELKSQVQPDAASLRRIQQLEEDITGLQGELEEIEGGAEKINAKIRALQEKILEVGGVKLRTQQAKVSDLRAEIDHASDRLTKAEVGRSKAESDVTKLTKSIATHEAALANLQDEVKRQTSTGKQSKAEIDEAREAAERAQGQLEDSSEKLGDIKSRLDERLSEMNKFKAREFELRQQMDEARKKHSDISHALAKWTKELAKLKLHDLDDDEEEDGGQEAQQPAQEGGADAEPKKPSQASELREYTPEEMDELDASHLQGEIARLEDELNHSTYDIAVLKEYARREKEFLERAADLDAVNTERDSAKKFYDDLRSQRLREFMEGFGIISMKLKEMYQMITLGGNAELELVDSLDPFSEGIIFSVMPPKKSWKNISNLSGGEKTLSSLALVFALHVFKPTPLYFMDEIDAALDFRNVSIVANYIKDRTKNAQFIIISLRNNMFELASRLVGIYKVNNGTHSVSIDNDDLHEGHEQETAVAPV